MKEPYDLALTAFLTCKETLEKGLRHGHKEESWRDEPTGMHLLKSSRHANTAQQLMDHPDFCKDKETALDHAKQAMVRAAMAVVQLMAED